MDKKNVEAMMGLSPMQEGLLFHYLNEPESENYVVQLCLVMKGKIDFQHFTRAWQSVVETNEMLRVVFRWENVKHPVQIVLKSHLFVPGFHEFVDAETDPPKKHAWLEEIISRERGKKFRVQNDVPFRVTLCKLREDEHWLIICNHHILYDGWSTGIILEEFFHAYHSLKDGLSLHPPVKTKYKEFVLWLQQQDITAQKKFWQSYLKNFEIVTPLPMKRTNGESTNTKKGGSYRMKLVPSQLEKINCWSKTEKSTPACFMYTAWGILLERLTYSTDVLFGTTVSGRTARIKDIEKMVGLFIHILPLRFSTRPGDTVREVLAQVDKTLQTMKEYQFTPLTQIKESSRVDRQEELFDTILVIENYPLEKKRMTTESQLYVQTYTIRDSTHYDLTVGIMLFDEPYVEFTYGTNRYEPEAIVRLAGYFRRVMEYILDNPCGEAAAADYMSEEEKKQIQYDFNDTRAAFPSDKTIHGLFEEEAEKNPDLIALVWSTNKERRKDNDIDNFFLSFGELNKKSDALAEVLSYKGVGRHCLVVLAAKRSPEMIIGIMAVLKAGAAYLPIDLHYPADRVRLLLRDSNAGWMLTQHAFAVDIANEEACDVITLENQGQSGRDAGQSPNIPTLSTDPAYIIYTSGSTGKPKGSIVEHHSVVNRLKWMQKRYPIGPSDVILQKTPITFDVSVWELFWWALEGASLCLLNPGGEKYPAEIAAAVEQHHVTTLHFVPSMLKVMLEYIAHSETSFRLKTLKQVFASGEALGTYHVDKFFKLLYKPPGTKLINLYGPTEATVDVSYFDCYPLSPAHNHSIPIGKPIDNICLYILDSRYYLSPVGVPGQLFIGGVGLARGYLNNPHLTAEKFLDAPPFLTDYHSSPDGRTYMSGDLARWLPNGNIEFLGRFDHQVKIRGFRIEPGEIEKRLLEHDKINEAVVLDKKDEKGERYLCAHLVVRRDENELPAAQLRQFLLQKLPFYMIPADFVRVEAIPLTANGKIDRRTLQTKGARLETGVEYKAPRDDIEKKIAAAWQEVLHQDTVGIHDNFFDIGGNSLHLIRLNSKLQQVLGKEIPMVNMFKYPTIEAMKQYLNQMGEPHKETTIGAVVHRQKQKDAAIAIIGMALRFPGAATVEQFWENLKNGVTSISFFSHFELVHAGIAPAWLENPNYVKAKGYLEGAEYFDASFFNYSPRQGELLDPQVRIFLQCAWEALENGGYSPGNYPGAIGVYAGAANNFHWLNRIYARTRDLDPGEQFEAMNLNYNSFTTQVSYKLKLKGPSLSINTACSTSLAAVDLACRELNEGKCLMALAGGISITYTLKAGYFYQEGMVHSPDGHCRAFDANSRGTVGGNGGGIVLLKSLEQSQQDGDTIYAVIKGTATNNDGNRKVGFTAPSIEGQTEVVTAAMQRAGVEPESVYYVEAHGTGTYLGDPVEIEALRLAFNTNKKGYCLLGSVKTNIGHLDEGAGIAGLIKTALVLKHRLIPPSLHFHRPNPRIHFENSPFRVNTELKTLQGKKCPLRAGVNSFGIGGTNVHVVLEEAPPAQALSVNPRPYELILLSAKTKTALMKQQEQLTNFLRNLRNDFQLTDVAYTLQVGRTAFKHRAIAVCANPAEELRFHTFNFNEAEGEKKIVFVFPGLGGQYVNMGAGLYRHIPFFKKEVDNCFEILKSHLDFDLKARWFPPLSPAEECSTGMVTDFNLSQLLVFIMEYALARLLMRLSITPTAMVGYSLGEYTAACLSGVFSLEDALKIVVTRGKLITKVPVGVMLSVPLPAAEVAPLLKKTPGLAIAIDNGSSCIVAVPVEAVHSFEKKLREKRVLCMQVQTSYALHTHMMSPILTEFEKVVGEVPLNPPTIPYLSNVTGHWITVEQAVNPAYWSTHLSHTVRFADCLKQLTANTASLFIEIGPGRDLSNLIGRHIDNRQETKEQATINLVRPLNQNMTDFYYLLNRLGQLWLYGVKINWENFYPGESRRRIPLPTYPFAQQSFPVETDIGSSVPPISEAKKKEIADWFYIPHWTRSEPGVAPPGGVKRESLRLIFMKDSPFDTLLSHKLKSKVCPLVKVKAGQAFSRQSSLEYTINPQYPVDYEMLFKELVQTHRTPGHIIHLWGLGRETGEEAVDFWSDTIKYEGFYSLLFLAKAIAKQGMRKQIQLDVIANGIQEVTGTEKLAPGKAAVLGPIKVIPQEYPYISCRSIDVELPGRGSMEEKRLIQQLLVELTSPPKESVVAYRHRYLWVPSYHPLRLEPPPARIARLREKGIYLITGGLGKIGLTLAEYLAKRVKARLLLTGRTPLPPPAEWDQHLKSFPQGDISRKIKAIRNLEAMGANVLNCAVDVADHAGMAKFIAYAVTHFGPINGIIHAAGNTGISMAGTIQQVSENYCEEQFKPKIEGLLVLDSLFRGQKIDFRILTSSLAPILGGLTFTAYASANVFMDVFAYHANRRDGETWIGINWADWEFADNDTSHPGSMGASVAEFAITPAQGVETFHRILNYPYPGQIIVSAGDLNARIDKWVKLEFLDRQNAPEPEPAQNRPSTGYADRPHLLSPYVPPAGHCQEILARIWQDLFGYDRIGIDDDFFELGGDSLKAITVIAKIHQELKVVISLAEFFSQPTVKGLAIHIKNKEKSTYFSIESIEKKEYYALSSTQKRFYILQQMKKESIGYNETFVVVMEGKLEKERLGKVFLKMITRHESLRTSIHMLDRQLFQRIHQPDDIEFAPVYIDMQKQESASKEMKPAEKIIRDFVQPFDLSRVPLIRVSLVKAGKKRHILVIDMPHITTDGFSSELFIRDFKAFYAGKEPTPLKLQYKDYAEWQGKQKESIKKQEEYWINQFKGEIPILNLPTDHSRPVMQSFEGRRTGFTIGEKKTALLNRLARDEGVTSFMLLLALYNIFLSKISNQDDIIVGTPVAGRNHADLQQIIGIFVNTLALRNYPCQDKVFKHFLVELKERSLEAFENQDYQFEDLVEKVTLNRDLSRNPLLDVMFILQDIDVEPGDKHMTEMHDLRLIPYNHENKTSRLDLTLIGYEEGGQLHLTFEYSTKLFSEQTIARFIHRFKTILSYALEASTAATRIGEMEIIPREEKRQFLYEFNDTATEYASDKTYRQSFEQQVKRTPGHIALACMEHEKDNRKITKYVTYLELNKRSNRLAGILREKGISPGTIVALMADRSLEMMIGLLAILKAGAAYLPIGTEYPQNRIDYMLVDSCVNVRLITRDNGNAESTLQGMDIYINNEKNKKYLTGLADPPPVDVPTDIVYVIYTSGSTGKPKGVVIENRSIINFMKGITSIMEYQSSDSVLSLSPLSFDFFGLATLLPLAIGSRVFIGGRQEQLDAEAAALVIEREHITILPVTPSRLQLQLLNDQSARCLQLLRYLQLGGEALPLPLLEKVKPLVKGKIYNFYGPTETTVFSTVKDVTGQNALDIGKPIANTRIYILDGYNRTQPLGVAGQLCIAGDGLARGYLNRPELTREKFQIPGSKSQTNSRSPITKENIRRNPFLFPCSTAPGLTQSTIYRTGDLARWLYDGNLEFLGRMDHQVKIRGFRVELEEIEKQLLNLEEIKEVVVTDYGEENYLCAYLVLNRAEGKGPLTVSQLRKSLAVELPEYMIPSYFVTLEKIPLTPNGKTDRKKLPEPERNMPVGVDYQPPTSETEMVVTDIWVDVLGIDKPGIHDDFFTIGGNSLKLILIYNRLNQHFPHIITVQDLFDKPTIKSLADFITKKNAPADTPNKELKVIDVEF